MEQEIRDLVREWADADNPILIADVERRLELWRLSSREEVGLVGDEKLRLERKGLVGKRLVVELGKWRKWRWLDLFWEAAGKRAGRLELWRLSSLVGLGEKGELSVSR